jgi:hypothetical protein
MSERSKVDRFTPNMCVYVQGINKKISKPEYQNYPENHIYRKDQLTSNPIPAILKENVHPAEP